MPDTTVIPRLVTGAKRKSLALDPTRKRKMPKYFTDSSASNVKADHDYVIPEVNDDPDYEDSIVSEDPFQDVTPVFMEQPIQCSFCGSYVIRSKHKCPLDPNILGATTPITLSRPQRKSKVTKQTIQNQDFIVKQVDPQVDPQIEVAHEGQKMIWNMEFEKLKAQFKKMEAQLKAERETVQKLTQEVHTLKTDGPNVTNQSSAVVQLQGPIEITPLQTVQTVKVDDRLKDESVDDPDDPEPVFFDDFDPVDALGLNTPEQPKVNDEAPKPDPTESKVVMETLPHDNPKVEMIFKCDKCFRKVEFKSASDLDFHEKTKHYIDGRDVYKCYHCAREFQKCVSYKAHVINQHETHRRMYRCQLCPASVSFFFLHFRFSFSFFNFLNLFSF